LGKAKVESDAYLGIMRNRPWSGGWTEINGHGHDYDHDYLLYPDIESAI
jgi:hypothetical protein